MRPELIADTQQMKHELAGAGVVGMGTSSVVGDGIGGKISRYPPIGDAPVEIGG
jgi:hypothetical protein